MAILQNPYQESDYDTPYQMYGNIAFNDGYTPSDISDLPLEQVPVISKKPTVTPSQISNTAAHTAEAKKASELATQQNVPAPDYSDDKYARFALQLQQQQAQSGINIPFTAPTKMSTLEDMCFSALGAYGIMKLLGAHSNQAWGIGLNAALHAMDSDNQMAERYPAIQQMLQQGYSWPAVMQWYRTGDTKAIEEENGRLATMQNNREARAEARYEADANRAATAEQNRQTNITNRGKNSADAAKNGVNLNYTNGVVTPETFETLEGSPNGTPGARGYDDKGRAKGQTGDLGKYQITDIFWNNARKHHPELNLPATKEEATDDQYRQAVQAYIDDARNAGYTEDQIVAGYQHGLDSRWLNNPNWESLLVGSPRGQAYLRRFREMPQYTVSQNSNSTNGGNSGQITYTDADGNPQTAYVETDKYGAPKLYGSDKSGHYYMTNTGQHIPYDAVSGSVNNKVNVAGQTADTVAKDLNDRLGKLNYTGSGNLLGQGLSLGHSLWNDDRSNAEAAYSSLNSGMEANMADRAVASAGGSQVLKADMKAQVDSAGKLSVNNSDTANRQVLDNWLNILGRAEFNTWYYNQYGTYPTPDQSREGGAKFEGAIMKEYPNLATAFTDNGSDTASTNSNSNVKRDANGNITGSSTGMNFTKH